MRTLSFPKLGRHGRLGNSLFQIAGTIGLAKKHGMRPMFPKWKYAKYFTPSPDLNFGHCPRGTRVAERHFHHHGWNIPSKGDVEIAGYLQSEKYFHSSEPIKFRSGFLRIIREKHLDLLKKTTLGIQIRRGDYVNNPNYTQLTMGYFISAMQKHFPDWQDRNILIFCEDVQYAKVHFKCLPNAHFVELNDIETLGLMTMMDGLIISNSSFGWWGAHFAEKHGAKIVRPSRHLDGELARNNDTKDLYPARWAVHDWDAKIDLMDCTFTIPVSYDHPDREENLSLTLRQLGRDFVTNILIQEQSGKVMKFEGFRSSVNVVGVLHFKSKVFHRTKMLNQMASMAQTPIVANWDADVIVAPMQILLTVLAIRSGKHQMVFPYDGIFARMDRKPWYQRVSEQDIGVARSSIFHGMTEGFISVGGAVFFNREYFLSRGGENEKFISYGAEDLERVERFKKLGASIQRVHGPLYHMNHWCGPDSSKDNPFFSANDREYKRICGMSRPQLEKEFLKV